MKYLLVILLSLFIISCSTPDKTGLKEKAKTEIVQTEKDFDAMAKEKGLAEAFYYFADDNAVLNRRDTVLFGKDEINKHYQNWKLKDVSLRWSADFVDASESGDLGYTYGKYTFSAMDTAGNPIESKGIFHTVWKKQKDGTWRFVWD